MTTRSTWLCSSLFLLSMATGCDEPVDAQTAGGDFGGGDVTDRCVSCNGIKLNTGWLGDEPLSVIDNTGAAFDGKRLQSVTTVDLGVMDLVYVKDGELWGSKGGKEYPDKFFLNSVWKLSVAVGTKKYAATLILKGMGYDSGNRTYEFHNSYTGPGGTKDPVPTCDDDPETPGEQFGAILSADIVIDPETAVVKSTPNKIYFGCVSGGVGKAARWGYPSHKFQPIEFETAIRVVRADYCGTGHSFTKTGMALQLTDDWNVNSFVSPNSATEALWDKSGAFCVGTPRLSAEWPDADSVQEECYALGAVPPKVCTPSMSLAEVPNAMFWSKLP